jgi:hypothetical protein
MNMETHIHRAVHVSGNANNGTKCSVRISNANNDFGNRNTNISSQLSILIITYVFSLPLGKKNKSKKSISRAIESSYKMMQMKR